MWCKFIFHLPSAGSMPLIITLILFAFPTWQTISLSFFFSLFLLSLFPSSLTPEAQLQRLLCFLSQFLLGSFCPPMLPLCIILLYSISLGFTRLYKTTYSLSCFCSQGTVSTESGSTRWSYLLAAGRGQTQDIHLAVWRPIKMSSLIFDMAFNQCNLCWKKKKKIFNITETKAFIYFWKHYLLVFFAPPLPSSALSFSFFFFSCYSYTPTSLWPRFPVSFRERWRLSRKDSHHWIGKCLSTLEHTVSSQTWLDSWQISLQVRWASSF